jgi:hypothetical protein
MGSSLSFIRGDSHDVRPDTELPQPGSSDERSFSSLVGQAGPGTQPRLGIHKLPVELHQQIMTSMRPQDLNRFSQTNRHFRRAARGAPNLSETLNLAEGANRRMNRLERTGQLNDLEFGNIFLRIGQYIPYIDDSERSRLIQATVDLPSEVQRSTAIGVAA